MLILRVALALGVAVLLVIGAWSTSHGKADAHAALCIASGSSATSTSGHHDGQTSVVDAPSSDTGLAVVAAFCGFLLALLLVRLGGGAALLRLESPQRTTAPPRAGPRRSVPALTLTQLSLSRT